MDDRFDELAKRLARVPSRRQALGWIGSLLIGAIAETVARPGAALGGLLGPLRRRPRCPKGPFERCIKPAVMDFVAAVKRCRPQCEGDPGAAACRSCVDPAVQAATDAARRCAKEVCHAGLDADGDGQGATAGGAVLWAAGGAVRWAAATPKCESARLEQCLERADRNAAICLSVAAAGCFAASPTCQFAAAGCMALYLSTINDCHEDHGCKDGGSCVDNLCCPHSLDAACNGVCCSYRKCQVCVDGACQGCKSPAFCNFQSTLRIQECTCPGGYLRCGATCCSLDQVCCGEVCCSPGEICHSGECISSPCQPTQVPCPNTLPGGSPPVICCQEGNFCAPRGSVVCCPPGGYLCGGYCCPDGVNTSCCEARGSVWCCRSDQHCCPGTGCQDIPCS
jgi:hypothetical protein